MIRISSIFVCGLFTNKQFIFVKFLVFFLKTSRLSPIFYAFGCNGHSKISCIYIQETYPCRFLMNSTLISELEVTL